MFSKVLHHCTLSNFFLPHSHMTAVAAPTASGKLQFSNLPNFHLFRFGAFPPYLGYLLYSKYSSWHSSDALHIQSMLMMLYGDFCTRNFQFQILKLEFSSNIGRHMRLHILYLCENCNFHILH